MPQNKVDTIPRDSNSNHLILPVSVFVFVIAVLAPIQVMVERPMLLLERFFSNGGWIEILVVATYGAFLAYKMQDMQQIAKWRRISWTLFSIWFFLQLTLGALVDSAFLLTGDLHIPVPAMMLGGPIYRGEKSIMTLLFLSTIILSGPAWCSQLCYFGALDNLIANKKLKPNATNRKKIQVYIKSAMPVLVIIAALVLRLFHVSPLTALISGVGFGIAGLFVIAIWTRKTGKMIHCIVYCPIGTIVNLLKPVSPFRLKIDLECTMCMKCSSVCKYDALTMADLEKQKPGFNCTLCGDCLGTCKSNSISYKFLNFSPNGSRSLYLFVTISLNAIFFAMGRI